MQEYVAVNRVNSGDPMAKATATRTDAELWRAIFSPEEVEVASGENPTGEMLMRIQLAFYVALQLLVVILAVAVLAALVSFVIQIMNGGNPTVAIGLIGTLVAGGGTGFLQKLASDALGRYNEAVKAREKSL